MLWQRALVAFGLGPLFLYLVYLGGWFYSLPLVVLLVIATLEYGELLKRLGLPAGVWLMLPANLLFWINGQWQMGSWTTVLLFLSLLATMCWSLWRYERAKSETAFMEWCTLSAGILLLGWLGSHFFFLRNLPQDSWQWTIMALLTIWIADSAAYAFGKRLGRRKLSPRLSPNKTIEGYVGGILGGTAFAIIIGSLLNLPVELAALYGLLTSIISPAGDLGISLIKRQAKVKDTGNLFPGHGGALDRIDSLLWSVALAYYFVVYFV